VVDGYVHHSWLCTRKSGKRITQFKLLKLLGVIFAQFLPLQLAGQVAHLAYVTASVRMFKKDVECSNVTL